LVLQLYILLQRVSFFCAIFWICSFIDRIINSEGGKAVIHYIAVYRKKTGDDVKEEKIETQYREFLKDLIYCWADGRCTFG